MALAIEDMEHVCHAVDADEVEEALNSRYEGEVNEFWLNHDDERFPALAIVVKGDLASLTYFPDGGHPGYKSMGGVDGLELGEFSAFSVNTPRERHLVLNDSIVPFSTALKAAKEFLADRGLPRSVEWVEL